MTEIASFRALSYRSEVRWRQRLEPGATGRRRQDKSGSPVARQALDRACLSPCWSVGSRAAPNRYAIVINRVFGTAAQFAAIGCAP